MMPPILWRHSFEGTVIVLALAGLFTRFTMPGFAQRLSDEQVAEVVTFIRSAWGNRAPSVSADDVRKARGTVTAAK